MKKYDEYKESGFGWIGEVPSLWSNLRLRFVCEFRNGYTHPKQILNFGKMALFLGTEWKI